nr:hypothetical protein RSP597_25460 [Ralstonia solanacearum]
MNIHCEVESPAAHRGSDAYAPSRLVCAAAGKTRLDDRIIAVLARTAVRWFAPDSGDRIDVRVENSRVYLTGHAQNGHQLPIVEVILRSFPGITCAVNAVEIDSVDGDHAQAPSIKTLRPEATRIGHGLADQHLGQAHR